MTVKYFIELIFHKSLNSLLIFIMPILFPEQHDLIFYSQIKLLGGILPEKIFENILKSEDRTNCKAGSGECKQNDRIVRKSDMEV